MFAETKHTVGRMLVSCWLDPHLCLYVCRPFYVSVIREPYPIPLVIPQTAGFLVDRSRYFGGAIVIRTEGVSSSNRKKKTTNLSFLA